MGTVILKCLSSAFMRVTSLPKRSRTVPTMLLGQRKVGIEIDKQSLAKAKSEIKDLFDSIGRLGR